MAKKRNEILNETKKYRGIEKFKDTFIITTSPDKVRIVLHPESRNTVQKQVSGIRKKIKTCEKIGCRKTNIEACHIDKERDEILLDAIKKNRKSNKYDVYRIMLQFRKGHEGSYPNNIRFLCSDHHRQMDETSNKKKYVKKYLKKPLST